MSQEILKKCSTCGGEFALEHFRKSPVAKDGLKYECRSCDDARQKAYYAKNHKKRVQQASMYKKENPEAVKEYNKRYYEKKKCIEKGFQDSSQP